MTEIEVDKGKKIEVDMRKKFEVNKRKKSDPFRILTEKTREKRNISTGFHLIQKKNEAVSAFDGAALHFAIGEKMNRLVKWIPAQYARHNDVTMTPPFK